MYELLSVRKIARHCIKWWKTIEKYVVTWIVSIKQMQKDVVMWIVLLFPPWPPRHLMLLSSNNSYNNCFARKWRFRTHRAENTITAKKLVFDSLQNERTMIVVTVFLLIMNQTVFRLVHKQKNNVTTMKFLAIGKESWISLSERYIWILAVEGGNIFGSVIPISSVYFLLCKKKSSQHFS